MKQPNDFAGRQATRLPLLISLPGDEGPSLDLAVAHDAGILSTMDDLAACL